MKEGSYVCWEESFSCASQFRYIYGESLRFVSGKVTGREELALRRKKEQEKDHLSRIWATETFEP